MSTTTKPVTHVADVAVNNASTKLVTCPSLAEIGNVNSAAPIKNNHSKTNYN